jgi:ubiquinone/menaquinone biosynthesis C-methylase UbiE
MAQSKKSSNYTQGYSSRTIATHLARTAESDASFLLPHIKKTDSILDVGCGPGTITTGFAKYATDGTIVGIDISSEVLQKAKSLAAEANIPTQGPGSVIFEEGNILSKLSYPDESFDVVFASQVFGHLTGGPDLPLRALAEIRRLLKPNGILATRDGGAQHFYPQRFNLDKLWGENAARAINHGETNVEPTGTRMPALFRQAGFDRFEIGAGTRMWSGEEARQRLAWRAEGQLKDGDPFKQSWLDAGITEEEIGRTLEAVRGFAETEDAWFVALQCDMLGWK